MVLNAWVVPYFLTILLFHYLEKLKEQKHVKLKTQLDWGYALYDRWLSIHFHFVNSAISIKIIIKFINSKCAN